FIRTLNLFKFFFCPFFYGLVICDYFIRMIFFYHSPVCFFYFIVGSRFIYFQNFISGICYLDKHGLDALKIPVLYPEISCYFSYFTGFSRTNGPIGLCNFKEKMQYLQCHFIPGSACQKRTDKMGRNFSLLYNFVKCPENGVSTLFTISSYKILPYIIQFCLVYSAIGFNDNRTK